MSPPRVHIIGRQNQGKTTLMAELVMRLTEAGVRVGTIKHSGHDHPLDQPGKDSDRHRQAGGRPAAFITPEGAALFMPREEDQYRALMPSFDHCDLVLVEGHHRAAGVIKVEVFRAGQGHLLPMAAEREDISLVITDDLVETEAPTCPRAEVGRLARWILNLAPPVRSVRSFVLAGGLSSRFGTDKARAMISGRPLIHHALLGLPMLAGDPKVVARRVDQYSDLGLETLGDLEPGLGPVGGLATALASLDKATPWALLLSCDVVGLRRQWLQLLLDTPRQGRQAVAFKRDRWQPLPGLYHRDLLPLCRELLECGAGSLWRVLENCNSTALDLPASWGELAQVNSPCDLANIIEQSRAP